MHSLLASEGLGGVSNCCAEKRSKVIGFTQEN